MIRFGFWVGTSPYQDFFTVTVSNLIIISHNATFWDPLFSLKSIGWRIYKYICFKTMFACFLVSNNIHFSKCHIFFWQKQKFFWESTFFLMLQVQNLNINHDFKPGYFDAGFQIFTQGRISFKSGTQILHLGAFDTLSRVLGRIWDMLWNNLIQFVWLPLAYQLFF